MTIRSILTAFIFIAFLIGGVAAPLSVTTTGSGVLSVKTAMAKKKDKKAKSCSKDDKNCNDQNENRKSEENKKKGKKKKG